VDGEQGEVVVCVDVDVRKLFSHIFFLLLVPYLYILRTRRCFIRTLSPCYAFRSRGGTTSDVLESTQPTGSQARQGT